MTTPRLGAPEISTSQASKEAKINETFYWLDAASLGGFKVLDRDLATPPGSPAQGDCYIMPASPTGAWSTASEDDVALYINTSWQIRTPDDGWEAWVVDEDVKIAFSSGAWGIIGTFDGADYVPLTYLDTDGTLAANSDTKLATQKATKTYIDAKVAGLSWKQAVRAATTANGTLASAFENGDTVDGVTLAAGDRILIKNQSSGSENGIYVVNASGAPTRATDADSGAEMVNASVYVSEGTTNADTQWTCTTNAPITLGSTSLSFAQFISSSYNDEAAQDAVGSILTDTGLAVVTYNDATPSIDVNVPAAVASDYRTGTDATKALTSDAAWDAADFVSLNDSGGNIAVDLSTGINFTMTMDGDYTLSNPTNTKNGQTGCIVFTQDGTGTQTLAFGSNWKFAGGTDPTLSTAAGAVDVLFYQVISSSVVLGNLVKAIA